MLYTGVNHFNWEVSNTTTYPNDTSEGVQLTADAVAHTKGTDTAVLVGLAYDCWGMFITFAAGNTDATIRRQMVDILIDPAAGAGNAGSSWSVLINNLFSNSASTAGAIGGVCYYFPIFLPAGTAIGARTQDVVGAATVRMSMVIYGQPTRPDLVKVGHKVQTIGATTASTSGVSFTPGTDAVGSYSASMGTLTNDAWWWQVGIGSSDTGMLAHTAYIDVATDATAKYICMRYVRYGVTGSNEQSGKEHFGCSLPIRHSPAGTDVYVRGSANTTPDANMTAVVYAVT